jgi:hypothetical protein
MDIVTHAEVFARHQLTAEIQSGHDKVFSPGFLRVPSCPSCLRGETYGLISSWREKLARLFLPALPAFTQPLGSIFVVRILRRFLSDPYAFARRLVPDIASSILL